MAIIKNFGDAVHAVIPFMKAGGDPRTLAPDDVESVVRMYVPGWERQRLSLSYPECAHVLRCWTYVHDLVQKAESVAYDVVTTWNYAPDILLVGGGTACVVEIKSGQQSHDRRKGRRQIMDLVTDIESGIRVLHVRRVMGILLMFSPDMSRVFAPKYEIIYDKTLPPLE